MTQSKAGLARRRTASREWIYAYLLLHPCENCGEPDPIVLDFHHRDPRLKKYEISRMIAAGKSLVTLAEEVGKCAVLCSNCHRRVHAVERESWRLDKSNPFLYMPEAPVLSQ